MGGLWGKNQGEIAIDSFPKAELNSPSLQLAGTASFVVRARVVLTSHCDFINVCALAGDLGLSPSKHVRVQL